MNPRRTMVNSNPTTQKSYFSTLVEFIENIAKKAWLYKGLTTLPIDDMMGLTQQLNIIRCGGCQNDCD
jgi:hypothetical protein